jgi:hypothetical protein
VAGCSVVRSPYRLFVFLLPLALFLVAGIGVYADTTEQSPSEVASRSGLTGLIAKEVAAAATSGQTPAVDNQLF